MKRSIDQKDTLFCTREKVADPVGFFTEEIRLAFEQGKVAPFYRNWLGTWESAVRFPGFPDEFKDVHSFLKFLLSI
jgi:hypothetical protein